MCLFFFLFFFLQSVHTRVYSNHREAIYISLFPCKSRPRVPGITTRDRSTLKYKDVNTGQASRNVSTRAKGARRGAKISRRLHAMNVIHGKERNERVFQINPFHGRMNLCRSCSCLSRNAKLFASSYLTLFSIFEWKSRIRIHVYIYDFSR